MGTESSPRDPGCVADQMWLCGGEPCANGTKYARSTGSSFAAARTRVAAPLCALVREVVVRSVAERAAEAAEDGDDAPEADATLRRALGPDDPLPYFGPYFGMSGKQLAAEARARSLKVSGKKMELVARLEMDDPERRRGRAREETREP